MSEFPKKNIGLNVGNQFDALSASLEQAATDENYRSEFYNTLLDSTIFVLTKDDLTSENVHAIIGQDAKGRTLDLIHWQMQDGQSIVPFFSSVEKLTEAVEYHAKNTKLNANEAGNNKFISLPASVLFDFTLGQTLFLNPNSDYSKILYPDEIKGLIDPQSLFREFSIVNEVQGPLKLSTAEPEPVTLTTAATGLLKTHKPVTKAYLAKFNAIDQNESGYLIGLELTQSTPEQEIDALFMTLGEALTEYLNDEEILDLCLIQAQGCDVSQFFQSHIKPFYQRRLGGFLRDAIKIQEI